SIRQGGYRLNRKNSIGLALMLFVYGPPPVTSMKGPSTLVATWIVSVGSFQLTTAFGPTGSMCNDGNTESKVVPTFSRDTLTEPALAPDSRSSKSPMLKRLV